MNREIGGYFQLESFSGQEYYSNLIALNSARNCLLYLLKAKNIKKIYLPYFLCDSVTKLCDSVGYMYEHYSIDESFLPIFNKELNKGEYLYVVNYYGQITNEKVLVLKEKYGRIIIDNVQAFFQKPIDNIDTIYSCRKFFGVPDGAYLSTNGVLDENIEVDCSKDRMKHILGRFEGCASEYYKDFKENDASFVTLPLRKMSKLTKNLLKAIDYNNVIEIRNTNYKLLADELSKINQLKLSIPNGPYCYPLYTKNGMEIKKRLSANKIYIPTLWPNVLNLDNTIEKDFAENILPLPCDQRCTLDDMKYIVEQIKSII